MLHSLENNVYGYVFNVLLSKKCKSEFFVYFNQTVIIVMAMLLLWHSKPNPDQGPDPENLVTFENSSVKLRQEFYPVYGV